MIIPHKKEELQREIDSLKQICAKKEVRFRVSVMDLFSVHVSP